MMSAAPGDYEYRLLTAHDADVIAPLHVQIWRDTYTGLMSQEKLDSLDVAKNAERWRSLLTGENVPRVLGGFDRAGALVGWITVGEARDDDAPCARELWVLNVARAHHGSGVAQELIRQELADGPAYLWVVEGNDRAIAFYRKYGFELDGTKHPMPEGNVDLRMVRR